MTTAADTPLFETGDWTVSPGGLEHKGTGYFIARDQVGDRRGDGLWSWPVHMAEKSWVRPESFAEAFMGALIAYEMPPDAELAASFVAAGREGAERDGRRLVPAAGRDSIRIRPETIATEQAEEPDLPAWALPDEVEIAFTSPASLCPIAPEAAPRPTTRRAPHPSRGGTPLSRRLLGWLNVRASGT